MGLIICHLLFVLLCLQNLLVGAAPAPTEDDLAVQIINILGRPFNETQSSDASNALHQAVNRQSKSGRRADLNILAERYGWSWPYFMKDLEGESSPIERQNDDAHIVHLPVPRGNGSTFDLQVEKDTMCSATKFSIALMPGPDPTKPWSVRADQSYGEVSQRIKQASPEDITRNSRVFINTILKITRPIFGQISGDSNCREWFPMPIKRDLLTLDGIDKRDSVDIIIEVARSYVLDRIATAKLLYIGYSVAIAWNVGQVVAAGGQVFVGDEDQGFPDITAARRRVHSYAVTIASYFMLEQVQKFLGYARLGDVLCTKLIHPLVNVLFDNLQALYDQIRPSNGEENGNGIQKRDDLSTCFNVNDFKYLINNIGGVTNSIADDPKANSKIGCPNSQP